MLAWHMLAKILGVVFEQTDLSDNKIHSKFQGIEDWHISLSHAMKWIISYELTKVKNKKLTEE